ncbi:MAG: ATP-dependent zinc metalloprotease FtsH [Candidatus Obscuribacterales bacterium]|nr:ATP-dependent zinc metalloprotease FtsH [Candidatus Obscuribacterales bacterium]
MTSKSLLQVLGFIAVFAILAFVMQPAPQTNPGTVPAQPVKMEYSELLQTLDAKPPTIKGITVLNGKNEMLVDNVDGTQATVTIPSKAGEQIVLEKAGAAKVAVTAKDAPTKEVGGFEIFLSILINFLPMILMIGFFIWLMRRASGGMQSQMVQKRQAETQPKAEKKTFKDVAGCDEAKVEAQEVIDYLKNPGYFTQFGARPPRGILLIGPPGTGKTLLGRAIAGEAEAAFFYVTASEFVEMFVGVGAARVRALFDNARKNRPAIIFIDEIDAVGRQRGAGVGGGHDEREQTLNQLLTEMDGFTSNAAVVFMAATNRPDVLDPALVRPGRFDRRILVDAPDVNGREAIFGIHSRNKPLAKEVDLRKIAEICPGFTGADIEGACNEAATVALRRFGAKAKEMRAAGASEQEIAALPREITMADFDEGIDRVQMGPSMPSRAKTTSKEDLKNTSIHEIGHALISSVLKHGDPVSKITIVRRAMALGYVMAIPPGDRSNYTDHQLLARITMAMGGRAAQEVLLNTVDTGASNDFQQGWNIARRMVTEWGMSALGPIAVTSSGGSPFLGRSMAMPAETGPELSDLIDREVRCIAMTCFEKAKEIVRANEKFIRAANEVLMKKETMLGTEWRELLAINEVEQHSVSLDLECGTVRDKTRCAHFPPTTRTLPPRHDGGSGGCCDAGK